MISTLGWSVQVRASVIVNQVSVNASLATMGLLVKELSARMIVTTEACAGLSDY